MNQILEKNDSINKSHFKEKSSLEEAALELKKQIIDRGNLSQATIEQLLGVIDQLCEFPFGKYMIETKGANGFWTDYLISYPNGYTPGFNIEGKPLSYLENFILT